MEMQRNNESGATISIQEKRKDKPQAISQFINGKKKIYKNPFVCHIRANANVSSSYFFFLLFFFSCCLCLHFTQWNI